VRQASPRLKKRRIAVIGTGSMGRALLEGLKRAGFPMEQVTASRRKGDHLEPLQKEFGVAITTDPVKAEARADLVVIAVKPQAMAKVAATLKPSLGKEGRVYVSVAAGISTQRIASLLPKVPVARAMPNLACGVGEGMTCLAFGEKCSPDDRALVTEFFDAMGRAIEIDEDLMDAVTGLSGTGPMYIFIVIEALSDAGVKVGLSRHDANVLAAQTVLGASKMVVESGEHPIFLKDRVTSPGGTAISALHVMEKSGLRAIFMDAVEAATRRSKELGAGHDHDEKKG
jgi:pyrroline-5-carboxylate reductase